MPVAGNAITVDARFHPSLDALTGANNGASLRLSRHTDGVGHTASAMRVSMRAVGMAAGVPVGEQPAKYHPVRAGPDARDTVRNLEPDLLDLSEEVLGVAVEHHPANRDRRVVLVRPDLGNVERIEAV